MNVLNYMTTNLNSKLKSDINKAQTVDELKKIMLQMVDSQPAVDSKEIKSWVEDVYEYKNTLGVYLARNIELIQQDYEEGLIDKEQFKSYFGLDDLVSIKYIKATKKEWTCVDCKHTIHIGSEAFRSFRKLGEKHFEKRYRCISCMSKVIAGVRGETEAIQDEMILDEIIGLGQD